MIRTVEERFWSKVDRRGPDDCWEWQGQKNNKRRGYGKLKVNGKYVVASRYSYFLAHGNIPDGLFVCHHCDNTSCVNPSHLFLGTSLDNVRDMVRKGRNHIPKGRGYGFFPRPGERGIKNHSAKLTWDQVREIRNSYIPKKVTFVDLARRYGVSGRAVSDIVNNKTWVE